jgi:glycosyltransferase involved in cell wall biosynthesis
MRLGVFPVMAGRNAGGPETYERRLLASLAEIDREDECHVFCLSQAAADSFAITQPNFTFHVLGPGARPVRIAAGLPWRMVRTGIDVLHATFTPPPISPRPYVFTVHCLSSFTHPEFYDRAIRFRLNALIRRGLARARQIICVSSNTRDLVAEMFGVPHDRLAVVPNGVSGDFAVLSASTVREQLAARHGINYPYIIFIGKLEARKNILGILEAYAQFRREAKTDWKLVLVGRRTPTSHGIDETLDRLGLRQHVVELGYVEDADLPLFYNGAQMFLFPSLWEGFGIPVIEAMACGTPVLTSNLSALPDVAGDAALLVDPNRPEDVAGGICRLHADVDLRERLRRRGLERAKEFSWAQTARETLAVYRRVAKS